MIVLHPSYSVKKCFSFVDFDILSAAVTAVMTMIYGKQHDKVIKIHKSREHADYYEFYTKTIHLLLDEKRVFTTVIKAIVHELRHWQQDEIFECKFNKENYDESTSASYRNSPLEVDARNFEKLLFEHVIDMYRLLKVTKTINKKHELQKFHKMG